MNTKSIWHILEPVKGKIKGVFLLSVLSSLCSITMTISVAFFVFSLDKDDSVNWILLGIAAFFITLSFVCRIYATKISHLAAFDLEYILRSGLCEKFTRLSTGKLMELGAGGLAKVVYDDVKNLHGFVADSTPLLPTALVTTIVVPMILLYFDWRLALLNIAVLLLIYILTSFFKQRNMKLIVEYSRSRESVNNSIIEFIQAMPVVRTFDSDTASFSRYQNSISKYSDFVSQWYRDISSFGNLLQFLFNPLLILVCLLWYGAWLYFENEITVYSWAGVLLLSSSLSELIYPWFSMQTTIQSADNSAQRIFEIQNLEEMVRKSRNDSRKPATFSIEFNKVNFTYQKGKENALDDISFYLPHGSYSALIGESGSGKSTVISLLMKFWDGYTGQISIGGVNIEDIAAGDLMSLISYVSQDTYLFSGTLAENIRMGKPAASDDEVVEVAKLVRLHETIINFPENYNTKIGERGLELSGGQRQRVAIARAILRNAPILLLDEPTASIDPENEIEVMRALELLMKGKTVLIATHRLSTIRSCNPILVLQGGKIIERGEHGELINISGLYSSLWTMNESNSKWILKKND